MRQPLKMPKGPGDIGGHGTLKFRTDTTHLKKSPRLGRIYASLSIATSQLSLKGHSNAGHSAKIKFQGSSSSAGLFNVAARGATNHSRLFLTPTERQTDPLPLITVTLRGPRSGSIHITPSPWLIKQTTLVPRPSKPMILLIQ